MKKAILYLALFSVCLLQAQVGIGTTSPQAALDISSSDSGMLVPRVSLTSVLVAAPVQNPQGGALVVGTLVYNSATAGTVPNDVTPGYYYWNGTQWVRMEGGTSDTRHNTLDQAYDEGGAGAGREIVADAGAVLISGNTATSALQVINSSTGAGVSGQYNAVINNGTIGYVADVYADGVGVLIDQNDTNNPYSGLQVTTLSNNMTSSAILGISEAVSPAITAEGGDGVNTANTLVATNFRTNGGAAIDALGAVAIRSTSQVNNGSAYSGYFNNTVGAAAQFNGAGLTALSPTSLFIGDHRFGVVSQGNLIGTHSSFTNTVGAAFEGRMNAYGISVLFSAAVAFNDLWDVYYRTMPGSSTNDKVLVSNVVGPGVNATTIKKDDKTYIMPAISAPESLFQDYGTGTLINGFARIEIDAILTENILVDEAHPLKVFVQLEGDCNGVYVANKSAKGFDVVELGNGSSNVDFSYTIVATRASQQLTNQEGGTTDVMYSSRFFSYDADAQQVTPLKDDREINSRRVNKMEQTTAKP
ncbi:MAG: hypothetical protein RBR78_00760 [Flavobacteriaceae bacterium]|jgi:hypothetical protein|nr:hypothetical protein [Flavobacteriaceae bacterium]